MNGIILLLVLSITFLILRWLVQKQNYSKAIDITIRTPFYITILLIVRLLMGILACFAASGMFIFVIYAYGVGVDLISSALVSTLVGSGFVWHVVQSYKMLSNRKFDVWGMAFILDLIFLGLLLAQSRFMPVVAITGVVLGVLYWRLNKEAPFKFPLHHLKKVGLLACGLCVVLYFVLYSRAKKAFESQLNLELPTYSRIISFTTLRGYAFTVFVPQKKIVAFLSKMPLKVYPCYGFDVKINNVRATHVPMCFSYNGYQIEPNLDSGLLYFSKLTAK